MSQPADLSRSLAKLLSRGTLSNEAQRAFLDLPAQREAYETYRDVLREGDPTTRCCFVEEDMVSRYKTLTNGGRQIVSFHLAGDLVDLQSSLVKVADHGIRTHTPSVVFTIPCDDILQIAADYPELARAFWFETLVDGALFREWTLNVGRRTARERIAHLLLEFAYRLKAIGKSDGLSFTLPVTQADLADAVGMSAVHVNRSLMALRADGLVRMTQKGVVIEQLEALVREAGFQSTYLHPEGPRVLSN